MLVLFFMIAWNTSWVYIVIITMNFICVDLSCMDIT